MKPIRLLAILEADTITGPAKNLLQFAQTAERGEVEVSIATFRREGDSDLFLNAAAQAGIPTYPIAESGRFDRGVIRSLTSLARELAPDIIQTHAVKSHFLLRLAGLDRAAPWVAFHHGYTWPDLRARLYNKLDRWSLGAARRVVTVSAAFQDQLVRTGVGRDRISIVHNAIDSAWVAGAKASAPALRARLGIPAEEKVALIVGRLSREKDHLTLLDAMDRMRREGVILPHLVIVGEGPERSRIEQRVQALGLAAQVTMTGQTPSAEPYYGIADLAVLSSRSEGSPNALLEAMAACVPVVATAVGGIPEIVSDLDSALLVPPGDGQRMAQAMTSLLTDRTLADNLTSRARLLVETRHSPEARARTLCAIYRDLANARGVDKL